MFKRTVGVITFVCMFGFAEAFAQTAPSATWDNNQPKGGPAGITGSGTYANAPAGTVTTDIEVSVKDQAMTITTYKYGSGIGSSSKPNNGSGTWSFDTNKIKALPPGTYTAQVWIRFYDKNGKQIGTDASTKISAQVKVGMQCPVCPPPCCPPPLEEEEGVLMADGE